LILSENSSGSATYLELQQKMRRSRNSTDTFTRARATVLDAGVGIDLIRSDAIGYAWNNSQKCGQNVRILWKANWMNRSGPWTADEDDQLRKLAASKVQLDDIAKELTRSNGSIRMRAARLQIAIAKSGKLMACPAWLELSEDRTGFVFLSGRAAIVRKIFELSSAGLGGYTIAKQLNAQRIPTFGPSPQWDQSTIHNMLSNRATIGEYQPRRYATAQERPNGVRDRKGVPAGDVVKGYYPAVIEEDLFITAQQARRKNLASGRGRKGRLITNLFAGIPTCAYCGAPVRFHSNGNDKSLICSTVLQQQGCCRKGWSYRNFEVSFFKFVTEVELEATATQSERERFAELRTLIREASGPNVYDARLALLVTLKTVVSELKMASSGPTPTMGKPNARIRRDDPGRFFEVSLFGGAPHIFSSADKMQKLTP